MDLRRCHHAIGPRPSFGGVGFFSSRRCCEWSTSAWADAEQLFAVKTLTFLGFIGVLLANNFGNRAIKRANGTSTVGIPRSAFIVGGPGSVGHLCYRTTTQRRGRHTRDPVLLLGVAEFAAMLEYGAGHDCRVVRIHRFRIDRG